MKDIVESARRAVAPVGTRIDKAWYGLQLLAVRHPTVPRVALSAGLAVAAWGLADANHMALYAAGPTATPTPGARPPTQCPSSLLGAEAQYWRAAGNLPLRAVLMDCIRSLNAVATTKAALTVSSTPVHMEASAGGPDAPKALQDTLVLGGGVVGAVVLGTITLVARFRRMFPPQEELEEERPYEAPVVGVGTDPLAPKKHADYLQHDVRAHPLEVLKWIFDESGHLFTHDQERTIAFLMHNCDSETGLLHPRVWEMVAAGGGSIYGFIQTQSAQVARMLDQVPIRLVELDERTTKEYKEVTQDLRGVHGDISQLQRSQLAVLGRLDRNDEVVKRVVGAMMAHTENHYRERQAESPRRLGSGS